MAELFGDAIEGVATVTEKSNDSGDLGAEKGHKPLTATNDVE